MRLPHKHGFLIRVLCLALSLAPFVATPGRAATATQPGAAVQGRVSGTIQGLNGTKATVTLGNDAFLRTVHTDKSGSYAFADVPAGSYFLKAEARGYALGNAKSVTVKALTPVVSPDPGTRTKSAMSQRAASALLPFKAVALDGNRYTFHWNADLSRGGNEMSAVINHPPTVTFLRETLTVADPAAAETLRHDYNIILSNDGVTWSQEHAARLLAMMRTIPQTIRDPYAVNKLKMSKWLLTDQFLSDDVDVQRSEAGDTVTLSVAAMVYASPRMVLLDGVKGAFFSKRLHHALVRYVTNDGIDHAAVEKILVERFGTSTDVPDYRALTANTTREDQFRFTQFRPGELVEIINMFEEMPRGLHYVKGLAYLLRRAVGETHPRTPDAAAVAWPGAQAQSYIEFMDSAFRDLNGMHRLIIHEKTHFMWANLFDQSIRDGWIAVGGWYPDPAKPDEWLTRQTTTFVSAYAHDHNPDEDMAESMAAYILTPDLLRSRAPEKYAFIRDRIMHGSRFIASVREDLRFTVLDIFPDYDYPGKIMRVDVRVDGAPESDKVVTVELGLNAVPGLYDGAKYASTRIFSEIGTYVDVYLYPKDGNASVLTGQFTVTKFAKGGYWAPGSITVVDSVGNQRIEGTRDFSWKMFINNALEDTEAPAYVPHSLKVVALPTELVNGHPLHKVRVTWRVSENRSMIGGGVYAFLSNEVNGNLAVGAWGTFDPATRTATVDFPITEFGASGTYGVPEIVMNDAARNSSRQRFSPSMLDEALMSVDIVTEKPDKTVPELDLKRISITAEPTNPRQPNGETLVTIVYYSRDDKSGLGVVYYRLIDPQGISRFNYHLHDNTYTQFFVGDPTAWKRYEIKVVLPVGSAPGVWGLQELSLADKVNNRKTYDFVEILHFDVAR